MIIDRLRCFWLLLYLAATSRVPAGPDRLDFSLLLLLPANKITQNCSFDF